MSRNQQNDQKMRLRKRPKSRILRSRCCLRRDRQRAALMDVEHAMNVQRGIPFFVRSRCTSFAPRPAAAVLHPCRQSQPDRRSRSRQRSGKAEGKIKGAARTVPQCQSARGLGTARRLAAGVPCMARRPRLHWSVSVLRPLGLAVLRWSSCHEQS